ncbi:MAG: hypothetical protein R3212_08840 [Xanthomonadales bacterium]|nr:hypothetical protein [Xanthomonadales bacterium]
MNIKQILLATLIPVAMLFANPGFSEELVADFRGDRPMQTDEFEVKAPWILDWRVTGDLEGEMAVDVSLVKGEFNVHEGNVLKTKHPGNGVRLFNEGGRFFFRVDSTFAGWSLRVYQLTDEEAKLYTPKNPSILDY